MTQKKRRVWKGWMAIDDLHKSLSPLEVWWTERQAGYNSEKSDEIIRVEVREIRRKKV